MFIGSVGVIFLLLLGQIQFLNPIVQIAHFAYASILGSFIILSQFFKIKQLEKTTYILLSLLLLIYAISAIILTTGFKNTQLTEPVNEQYAMDDKDFLKTFYLMEDGESYYSAFASAIISDARFTSAPKDLTTWRFPTVFYFWKLVADNGNQIRIIFLTLSILSLFCSYLVVKKFVPPPNSSTLALFSNALFFGGFFEPFISFY